MDKLRAALNRVDQSVLDRIGTFRLVERRKSFVAFRDITALGGDAFLIVGGLLIASMQAVSMGAAAAFRIVLFLLLARLAGWLLKALFKRTRPLEPVKGVETFTSSFPSIHTMNAFCIFFALAFVGTGGSSSAALAVSAVFAAMVGSTRLVFRVHWPSDVLAGYLSGLGLSLAGSIFL